VPVAALDEAENVRSPVTPEATTRGFGEAVTPEGKPVAVIVTDPVKPPCGTTVTPNAWPEPCAMPIDVGPRESVNVPVGGGGAGALEDPPPHAARSASRLMTTEVLRGRTVRDLSFLPYRASVGNFKQAVQYQSRKYYFYFEVLYSTSTRFMCPPVLFRWPVVLAVLGILWGSHHKNQLHIVLELVVGTSSRLSQVAQLPIDAVTKPLFSASETCYCGARIRGRQENGRIVGLRCGNLLGRSEIPRVPSQHRSPIRWRRLAKIVPRHGARQLC
jgi:hypothetical protein